MRSSLEYCKTKFGDKPVIGAELGIHLGDNAKDILENFPTLEKLCLIDHVIQDPIIELKKRWDKVEIHSNITRLAANKYADGYFDFVYIDAGHDFKNVMRDILMWYPKIKQGGVICGHDYIDEGLFGAEVIRAVDLFGEYSGGRIQKDSSKYKHEDNKDPLLDDINKWGLLYSDWWRDL